MDENSKLNKLNDDLLELFAGGLNDIEEQFFAGFVNTYKEQGTSFDEVMALVDGAFGDQPEKRDEIYEFIKSRW